jgi:pyruvate dehydrogenase E1 component beta subunit
MTYLQAINAALCEEMERDESVFLLGEDIGRHGGAFGITRGLFDRFGPERVRDTPISENTLMGAALGASIAGMRPIVEIMFADFSALAFDQIANEAAKLRYMFGGQCRAPLVVRMPQGGLSWKSSAAHHSQSVEGWYVQIPGLKVVLPSTPADAKGLLKAAIRDDNPVIYLEHKGLYGEKGDVPDGDYTVPLGRADVKRVGKHCTVIAAGKMVQSALAAAETLAGEGIEIEVVDPRTLNPLDEEALFESVRKTHRAVLVSEAPRTGSVSADWGMRLYTECFDWLDAPVGWVAALDVPIPYNNTLEAEVWPTPEKIAAAAREACYA